MTVRGGEPAHDATAMMVPISGLPTHWHHDLATLLTIPQQTNSESVCVLPPGGQGQTHALSALAGSPMAPRSPFVASKAQASGPTAAGRESKLHQHSLSIEAASAVLRTLPSRRKGIVMRSDRNVPRGPYSSTSSPNAQHTRQHPTAVGGIHWVRTQSQGVL